MEDDCPASFPEPDLEVEDLTGQMVDLAKVRVASIQSFTS